MRQLAADAGRPNDGYGISGHIFAIGYLRGLQQGAERAHSGRSRAVP